MNINHDGATVSFKTAPKELFLAEKSGAKSNLLCLMDFHEWQHIKKHTLTKIIIQHQQEIFQRTLTNIHLEGEMLNTWVVTFSWTHEKHHHSLFDENTHDPNINFISYLLDEDRTPPPGSHLVPSEQGDHSVGLQQEAETRAETCEDVEEPSTDECFTEITISNGTLALLQSISHGRTMNMVIKELYESYLNRKNFNVETTS